VTFWWLIASLDQLQVGRMPHTQWLAVTNAALMNM